jgi:hypothetical protein
VLTAFIVGILIGYIFVMWRCNSNLGKCKSRLDILLREKFPAEAQKHQNGSDRLAGHVIGHRMSNGLNFSSGAV